MADNQKIKDEIEQLSLDELIKLQSYIDSTVHRKQKIEDENCEKASLKIIDIHMIGGIGTILELETVSSGIVKTGFQYKIVNGNSGTITIKSFENNFCPYKFEHPTCGILACVSVRRSSSFTGFEKNILLEPF